MKRNLILIFGFIPEAISKLATDLRGKNPSHEIGLRSAPHFRTAEYEDAEEVHVIGDYPDIVDAYEANDVKVVKHAAPKAKPVKDNETPPVTTDTTGENTHLPTIESQKAFLKQKGVKFSGKATLDELSKLVDQTKQDLAEDAAE